MIFIQANSGWTEMISTRLLHYLDSVHKAASHVHSEVRKRHLSASSVCMNEEKVPPPALYKTMSYRLAKSVRPEIHSSFNPFVMQVIKMHKFGCVSKKYGRLCAKDLYLFAFLDAMGITEGVVKKAIQLPCRLPYFSECCFSFLHILHSFNSPPSGATCSPENEMQHLPFIFAMLSSVLENKYKTTAPRHTVLWVSHFCSPLQIWGRFRIL